MLAREQIVSRPALRVMHRTCPFCASDPPLAAQIAGRFIVGCESDDCAANPQVSGATVDEAWKRWDTPRMNIKQLRIDYGNNGKTIISGWVDCHSTADCDAMITWLKHAKASMEQWEKIEAARKNAEHVESVAP